VLLTACGGAAPVTPAGGPVTGDAARGQELFHQTVTGSASAPGCVTCHALEPGVTLVGPSLAGVGAHSPHVEGLSMEAYLHQSIAEPDAFVVEGFAAGVMYRNYGRELSQQQLADLVVFLQSLQ
jgi:mono/diheme cytochrome c family protein